MKLVVLFSLLSLGLFIGCATQPAVSGYTANSFGDSAEKIWNEQLNKRLGGKRNKAEIRAVRGGRASVNHSAGLRRNANVGMILGETNSIQTGVDTQLDLYLGDNGPVLRLVENTTINFVRLDVSHRSKSEKIVDTMIELKQGRLLGNVKKLSAASSYLIRSRTSVLQIRGTEFSIEADGRVEISLGTAKVFSKEKTYLIESGNAYIPGNGVKKL